MIIFSLFRSADILTGKNRFQFKGVLFIFFQRYKQYFNHSIGILQWKKETKIQNEKKNSIDELVNFQIEHSVDQITWRSSDLRLIVILTLKNSTD